MLADAAFGAKSARLVCTRKPRKSTAKTSSPKDAQPKPRALYLAAADSARRPLHFFTRTNFNASTFFCASSFFLHCQPTAARARQLFLSARSSCYSDKVKGRLPKMRLHKEQERSAHFFQQERLHLAFGGFSIFSIFSTSESGSRCATNRRMCRTFTGTMGANPAPMLARPVQAVGLSPTNASRPLYFYSAPLVFASCASGGTC